MPATDWLSPRRRIVEVIAELDESAHPMRRYGSGLLLGARQVLTCAHVVSGAVKVWVRQVGEVTLAAAELDTALVGEPDPQRLDLALLTVPACPDLPGVPLGSISRDVAGWVEIKGCCAVGFPEFAEVSRDATGRPIRESKQVVGSISPLSGLKEDLLFMEVSSSPAGLPQSNTAHSPWEGMSGSAVFAPDDRAEGGEVLIGVIVEHVLTRGLSDITVLPLSRLFKAKEGSDQRQVWCPRLGISDCAALLELPVQGHQGTARVVAERSPYPLPVLARQDVSPWLDEAFLDHHYRDRTPLRKDICQILESGCFRMVCIFGRPGIGRTALAEKCIRDLTEGGGSAPISVRLAPLLDGVTYLSARGNWGKAKAPGDMVHELYQCCTELVRPEQAGDRLREIWKGSARIQYKVAQLIEELKSLGSGEVARRFLIAIDDIDALLDQRGWFSKDYAEVALMVESMLASPHGPLLIATSLQPMQPPTALASLLINKPLNDGLPEEEAIARLRDLDPGGVGLLGRASAEELRQIVTLVHGAPKALDLVHGLLHNDSGLTIGDIKERFYKDEEVVSQLSAWRWQQLGELEQRIMVVMTVYGRPVPIEAIHHLLSVWPNSTASSVSVGDAIHRLIQSAVLQRDPANGAFSMDAIDRDICARRSFVGDGGVDRLLLHKQAATYYRTCAVRIAPAQWRKPDDAETHLREIEQLMAAQDHDGACQLLDQMDYSWCNHHKFSAWMLMLGMGHRLVERREKLIGKLSSQNEARNLAALGWVYRRLGQPDKARDCLLKVEHGAEAPSADPIGRLFARTELGFLQNDCFGDRDGALAYLVLVQQEAQNLGERYWVGMSLLGQAYVEFDFADDDNALAHASQAMSVFQAVGSPLRVIDALVRMGMLHRKQKKHDAALHDADLALKEARDIQSPHWTAEVESAFGFHYRGMGDYRQALRHHEKAYELYSHGAALSCRESAVQQSYRANLLIDVGLFEEACEQYEEARNKVLSMNLERERSWILSGKAMALQRMGCTQAAKSLHKQALQIVVGLSDRRSQIIRLTDMAASSLIEGQAIEAVSMVMDALTLAAECMNVQSQWGSLPGAYVHAPYMADALPHEMQAPGDHLRRGLILALAQMQLGDVDSALALIKAATKKQHQVVNLHHRSALIQGLIMQHLDDGAGALPYHARALDAAQERLRQDSRFWSARVTRAVALAAQRQLDAAVLALQQTPAVRQYRGVHDELMLLAALLPAGCEPFKDAAMALQPGPSNADYCARFTGIDQSRLAAQERALQSAQESRR